MVNDDFKKLAIINKLKEVNRRTTVINRYENPAEHSWSAMMLAVHFMPEDYDQELVLKLLLFHDFVEVLAGDVFFFDEAGRAAQKPIEEKAYKKLIKMLPDPLSSEFAKYWREFEHQTSKEARFAIACDKIDPVLQTIFEKRHFTHNEITKEMMLSKMEKYCKDFPRLETFFKQMLKYAEKKGYFR